MEKREAFQEKIKAYESEERPIYYLDESGFATAVFSWIEGWYNNRRLHSAIDYLSPLEFERRNTWTSVSLIQKNTEAIKL